MCQIIHFSSISHSLIKQCLCHCQQIHFFLSQQQRRHENETNGRKATKEGKKKKQQQPNNNKEQQRKLNRNEKDQCYERELEICLKRQAKILTTKHDKKIL